MTAAIHELHGIGDINSNDVAILVVADNDNDVSQLCPFLAK